MADLLVLKNLEIQSHRGPYSVQVCEDAFLALKSLDPEKSQLVVDQKVYELYLQKFEQHLSSFRKTMIVAVEENKNIDRISAYVDQLMKNQVKLDHTLVAIGGGIVQDITCFLASTLFRGMAWQFVPTTLLAQADSCIGSKSSINVGPYKNLMGTFTPPQKIYLDVSFLDTLERKDISSGIGEILKVHMIKSVSEFEKAAGAIERMKSERPVLLDFVYKSLVFKKEKIEADEFDKGIRNVMNYGHSYGHAIEAATDFAIPHGVAITVGMDMANYQSFKMGRISKDEFERWHQALATNYNEFKKTLVPLDKFLSSIQKDKKNVGSLLSLILVRNDGPIEKVRVTPDDIFTKNCKEFFSQYWGQP